MILGLTISHLVVGVICALAGGFGGYKIGAKAKAAISAELDSIKAAAAKAGIKL